MLDEMELIDKKDLWHGKMQHLVNTTVIMKLTKSNLVVKASYIVALVLKLFVIHYSN